MLYLLRFYYTTQLTSFCQHLINSSYSFATRAILGKFGTFSLLLLDHLQCHSRPLTMLFQQADGEDELKKRQLMELAIINGTYRDSSAKAVVPVNGQCLISMVAFMFCN